MMQLIYIFTSFIYTVSVFMLFDGRKYYPLFFYAFHNNGTLYFTFSSFLFLVSNECFGYYEDGGSYEDMIIGRVILSCDDEELLTLPIIVIK